jgi:hypothetical protein
MTSSRNMRANSNCAEEDNAQANSIRHSIDNCQRPLRTGHRGVPPDLSGIGDGCAVCEMRAVLRWVHRKDPFGHMDCIVTIRTCAMEKGREERSGQRRKGKS